VVAEELVRPSPFLSAERINALLPWALDELRRQVRMMLRGVAQDGYLPLTELPKTDAEEMEQLQRSEAQDLDMMLRPGGPESEPQRAGAQRRLQRLRELRAREQSPR
jgi:hypothetical protein